MRMVDDIADGKFVTGHSEAYGQNWIGYLNYMSLKRTKEKEAKK